ncbi:hypothetical protein BDW59DRAFT_164578 [Aspergillus cavernicola]|uniref:Uncharacterized protein n=1 Tax=Aspergillus cavernicola TaxID=176166 RepID=A0ABR4HYH8_9EURO
MATPQTPSPRISFDEDDKRPFIKPYGDKKPKFYVGDKDGTAVKNGTEIDGDFLEASPILSAALYNWSTALVGCIYTDSL